MSIATPASPMMSSLVKITTNGNKIPVRLPNNRGWVEAIVSPEDFPNLSGPDMRWRLGSSGYPMFVKRVNKQLVTVWMHKLVAGRPATHINGDRLDCRRENLIPSCRKSPFEISTRPGIGEEAQEYDWCDRDLRFYSGPASITYDEGKVFVGHVVHGIPHGFGTLYEPATSKISAGDWIEGVLKKGMVTEHEYLPRAQWSERRVKRIQLIDNVR